MSSTLCGSSALVKMDQDLSPVESSIKDIMYFFNKYSRSHPLEMTQEELKELAEKELPNFIKKSDFMHKLFKQLDTPEKRINTEELFEMLARMGQTS